MDNQPVLLKKADVCARLNFSYRHLENMVKAGKFPPGEQIGKHRYWSAKAVDAWIRRKFGAQENWRQ